MCFAVARRPLDISNGNMNSGITFTHAMLTYSDANSYKSLIKTVTRQMQDSIVLGYTSSITHMVPQKCTGQIQSLTCMCSAIADKPTPQLCSRPGRSSPCSELVKEHAFSKACVVKPPQSCMWAVQGGQTATMNALGGEGGQPHWCSYRFQCTL